MESRAARTDADAASFPSTAKCSLLSIRHSGGANSTDIDPPLTFRALGSEQCDDVMFCKCSSYWIEFSQSQTLDGPKVPASDFASSYMQMPVAKRERFKTCEERKHSQSQRNPTFFPPPKCKREKT